MAQKPAEGNPHQASGQSRSRHLRNENLDHLQWRESDRLHDANLAEAADYSPGDDVSDDERDGSKRESAEGEEEDQDRGGYAVERVSDFQIGHGVRQRAGLQCHLELCDVPTDLSGCGRAVESVGHLEIRGIARNHELVHLSRDDPGGLRPAPGRPFIDVDRFPDDAKGRLGADTECGDLVAEGNRVLPGKGPG